MSTIKLLLCPACHDVRKLQMEPDITTCDCGKSWGFYKHDGWNAVIGAGLAIGVDNNSVAYALRERLNGNGKSVYLSAWLMATDHKTIEYGQPKKPEHVCGKQGFGIGVDGWYDVCAACEWEQGERDQNDS